MTHRAARAALCLCALATAWALPMQARCRLRLVVPWASLAQVARWKCARAMLRTAVQCTLLVALARRHAEAVLLSVPALVPVASQYVLVREPRPVLEDMLDLWVVRAALVARVVIFRSMVVSAVLAAEALRHCSAAAAAQRRAAACRSLRLMAAALVVVAPYRCARAHRAAARAALCPCVPGLPREVMAALSVSLWVLVLLALAGWSRCLPVRLLAAAVVLCRSHRARRRAKVRLEAVSLSLQVALMLLRVAEWSCSAVRARAARVVLCRCALPTRVPRV